jgi:hypothetical protein
MADEIITPVDPYEDLYAKEKKLADDYQAYQDALSRGASQQSLLELRNQARKDALAFQEAGRQISEKDFFRQRQLMQGAQSRGLGGSGLEQLAQTQSRMATGQQISSLAQAQAESGKEARSEAELIKERLTNALKGSQLQRDMGTLAAEEKLLGRQDATNAQNDAAFQALLGGLAAATTEEDIKLLETYYKGRLPDDLIAQATASARTRLGVSKTLPPAATTPVTGNTTLFGQPAGVLSRSTLSPEQRNDPKLQAAFAADAADSNDNDGQIVALRLGEGFEYFANDKAAEVFITNYYKNMEQSDKIVITVNKGIPSFKIAKLPNSASFKTYNEALKQYYAIEEAKIRDAKTPIQEPSYGRANALNTGVTAPGVNYTPTPGENMAPWAVNFSNWLTGLFSGKNSKDKSSADQMNNIIR